MLEGFGGSVTSLGRLARPSATSLSVLFCLADVAIHKLYFEGWIIV